MPSIYDNRVPIQHMDHWKAKPSICVSEEGGKVGVHLCVHMCAQINVMN